jgi:hypothetical protein
VTTLLRSTFYLGKGPGNETRGENHYDRIQISIPKISRLIWFQSEWDL